jgi:hypothetical protein
MRRLALLLVCACGTGQGDGAHIDTGLDALEVSSVSPGALVPGSRLVVGGAAFVHRDYGTTALRLVGTFAGKEVDVQVPLDHVDYDRLEGDWPGGREMGMGADHGEFVGEARVEVVSRHDGQTYRSPPRPLELAIREQLEPRADAVQEGTIRVNEPILVDGDGFLLGEAEGHTLAVLEGCFRATGAETCESIGPVEVTAAPETDFDRTRVVFPFHPRIAGIQPGTFTGTVTLVNQRGQERSSPSAPLPVEYVVLVPTVTGFAPQVASLGQYVDIEGGGFVGPDDDMPTLVTTLHLEGSFLKEGFASASPVILDLIPIFVSGHKVRYVVSEDDDLASILDLRKDAGSFTGTVRPTIRTGTEEVSGESAEVSFAIGHVKQVVWVRFLPSYVESLRHFGLRALDARIRERVLAVARRDYAGVGIEFRSEPPADFALYSTVELSGPDPNGKGLFGYDNTPGKDVGNLRLYDKVGGGNAQTLDDGNLGYGGVFIESFFRLGLHPGEFGTAIEGGSDQIFDQIFDPFRPDLGGLPVLSNDVGPDLVWRDQGGGCPASERREQIACAVFVLGNLIGSTMSHEIGHSLGLANPTQSEPHNRGDEPNRLMDSGGARTVRERAELDGQGPSVFCRDDFEYLRRILPSSEPAPAIDRPRCF